MATAGDLMREAREARGWTQVEYADRINTSATTVSNWERGVTKPGIEDINTICAALGLSADVLLMALDVLLTPAAASKLPRDLVLDMLALDQEDLAALGKAARGLRLAHDGPGSRR